MRRRIVGIALFCLGALPATLQAQEFRLFDQKIQVHGFASQGYVLTTGNNWLSMTTNDDGSAGFTDFGLNMSTQVNDKFRVGAQFYDRNLGQLGQYHPSLDWAVADYRFKPWLGLRGGKVKTILGLYNDTQDLDFLHTFALLPQSVYPTDIRDATIAHTGGDIYGDVILRRHLGTISYTAYAGHRSDSLYSGYAYLELEHGIHFSSYGGLQHGGDVRWQTPWKGLLIGVSQMNQDVTGRGVWVDPLDPNAGFAPFSEVSKSDRTRQFFAEYTVGRLRVDSEYRRYVHEGVINRAEADSVNGTRGWYVSGAYRVIKQLELGSYYSRYSLTDVTIAGDLEAFSPVDTDTSLPANHIYDKVITARIDLKRYWNVKIEGHFMNGYAGSIFPSGFYPQENQQGFKPDTNALVLKTSINF
jgi:hypothetical protein